MKKALFLIMLLAFCSTNFSQELKRNKDSKSKKWGFIDAKGEAVIPHRFYSVSEFNESGHAFVRVTTKDSSFYDGFTGNAVINKKGELILTLDVLEKNFEEPEKICAIIGPAGNDEYYVCEQGISGSKGLRHCKVDINGKKSMDWQEGALSFYPNSNKYVKRLESLNLKENTLNVTEQLMSIDGEMIGKTYAVIDPFDEWGLFYVIDGNWIGHDKKVSLKKADKVHFAHLLFKTHDYYFFEPSGVCSILNSNLEPIVSDLPNLAVEFPYYGAKPYFVSYEKAKTGSYVVVITSKNKPSDIKSKRWVVGDYTGKGKGTKYNMDGSVREKK